MSSPSCCRAGERWDKQHGVGVERAELMARTRDAVARGQQTGHLWHAATHIEHARPMLLVSPVLCQAAMCIFHMAGLLPSTWLGTDSRLVCLQLSDAQVLLSGRDASQALTHGSQLS